MRSLYNLGQDEIEGVCVCVCVWGGGAGPRFTKIRKSYEFVRPIV